MNIQFHNFAPINSTNVKSNFRKTDISFKGNEENSPVGDVSNVPPYVYTSIQLHPIVELNLQLIKDGYSKDEIKEHGIFFTTKIRNVDFSNPQLLEAAMEGIITKDDIFSKNIKSDDDVKAMQKAYFSLKEKFNTPDVRKHVAEFNAIEDKLNAMFSQKGIDLQNRQKYSAKSMILTILRYVNKDNEPLLQQLLNDKNFNNVFLHHALMSIDKNKDMQYSFQVLEMAQETGYKKEFSLPLSILISEANEDNIRMIEKMLDEQDFLSKNNDFVSNKLMNFLREAGTGLSLEYERNDDLTLNEIQELLDLEDSEY